MRKRPIAVLCVMCLALMLATGCYPKQPLNQRINRATIRKISIEYLSESKGERMMTATQNADEATDLLDIVLDSTPVNPPDASWYSPAVSATHLLILDTDNGPVEIYYDQLVGLMAMPLRSVKNGVEQLDYAFYESSALDEQIGKQREFARIPFEAGEEAGRYLDANLLATVVQEDFEETGKVVEYETAQPPEITAEEPYYRVLRDGDREDISVPTGQYLVVAGLGMQKSGGFDIEIDNIQVNDHYIKVRVIIDRPVEGELVDSTPTSPAVAVLVGQKDFPSKKMVVFVDDGGNKLYLQRLD